MIFSKILLQYVCLHPYSRIILLHLLWSTLWDEKYSTNRSETSEKNSSRNKWLQSAVSLALILIFLLNNPLLLTSVDSGRSIVEEAIHEVIQVASDSPSGNLTVSPAAVVIAAGAKAADKKASSSFGKVLVKQSVKYLRVKYKKTIRRIQKKIIRQIPLRWKWKIAKWSAQRVLPLIKNIPKYAFAIIKPAQKIIIKFAPTLFKQGLHQFVKSLPWIATKVLPRVVTKLIPGLNAASLVLDVYNVAKWLIPKVSPLMFKVLMKS